MDWILAGLALFNLGSIAALYSNRNVERTVVPWVLFGYSLIASELAWLWLPLQIIFALMLIKFGALASPIGICSIILLLLSWIVLSKNIRQSFNSRELTELALRKALGDNYLSHIPAATQSKLEIEVTPREWLLPFKMHRNGVEQLKNIAYGPMGVKHQLDIYRPDQIPAEGCPVVLQIHGGAWVIGSKDHQALPLMNLLASKGWICVAINYRLSPSVGFPTHLEDCKRALCWIRTEGEKYGMNPDFIAVTGGSAGGHLCSLMGLTANFPDLQQEYPDVDTSVQAVIPYYGVYDLLSRSDQTNRKLLINFIKNRVIYPSPEENPELWDLASPVSHVRRELPPFMIIQGDIDSLISLQTARNFHQQLKEKSNSPAAYLELPGAEHAFDNIHSPRTDYVIKGVHRFLEWTLAQHRMQRPASK